MSVEGALLQIRNFGNAGEIGDLFANTEFGLLRDGARNLLTDAFLVLGGGAQQGLDGGGSEGAADGAVPEGAISVPSL